MLGWGLSGQILTTASWHWAFRLPGILVLTYAVIWLVSTRKLLASKNGRKGSGLAALENLDSRDRIIDQNDEIPLAVYKSKQALGNSCCLCVPGNHQRKHKPLGPPVLNGDP